MKAWIPSPTRVKMLCWADGRWATGNYGASRWFRVHDYHRGFISFIHSSYVFNQISVGRC